MGRDRANLKVSPDQLERFNRLRGDISQRAFFEQLMDAYESDGSNGERIDTSESAQLDRIEELVKNAPGRTADAVEERMSRR